MPDRTYAPPQCYCTKLVAEQCRCCVQAPPHAWHEYNDAHVKEISADEICTPEAYLLFYRRKQDDASSAEADGAESPAEPEASAVAVDEEKVGMLCAMGFTEEQSRSALEASNGDAEAACNMLLS